MDIHLTQFLAIWGAVLSTIALCWQVFQWTRSNPRIATKVQMHEGRSSPEDDWISFELRNRGGKPTTIEKIMFIDYDNAWSRFTRSPERVENIYVSYEKTMVLPVMLQPGEVWKGICPLDASYERRHNGKTRRERFETRRLFYRIKCAHTDRPISGIVKSETFFERM